MKANQTSQQRVKKKKGDNGLPVFLFTISTLLLVIGFVCLIVRFSPENLILHNISEQENNIFRTKATVLFVSGLCGQMLSFLLLLGFVHEVSSGSNPPDSDAISWKNSEAGQIDSKKSVDNSDEK